MKIETFKPGDRVTCWLGPGTIVEAENQDRKLYEVMGWTAILFDTDPPIEFNMGYNPAFWKTCELDLIGE